MNFSKSSDSSNILDASGSLDEREDRFVKVGLLLDYYESVISKKQFDTLDMYYNKDMSLSEIGEALGITRQGVYEILKRGEKRIFELEEKLHCHELTVACDGLRKALLKVSVLQKDLSRCENTADNEYAEKKRTDISFKEGVSDKKVFLEAQSIASEALEKFPFPGKN